MIPTHFAELVANCYEFEQSHLYIFIRSACIPLMVRFNNDNNQLHLYSIFICTQNALHMEGMGGGWIPPMCTTWMVLIGGEMKTTSIFEDD